MSPAPATSFAGPAPAAALDAAARAERRPVDAGVRRPVERAFGMDLADVGVRTGPDAARAARLVWANAFAAGREIVLGANAFPPDSAEGRLLVAHELVHVVQQLRAGRVEAGVSTSGDRFEAHADAAAVAALDGGVTGLAASLPGGAPPALARQDDRAAQQRRRELDEVNATVIGMTGTLVTVLPAAAVAEQAQSLTERFAAEDQPLTHAAAARALRELAAELHRRESQAPRDPKTGALLELGADGAQHPWLPSAPRSVAEIPPFGVDQEAAWEIAATLADRPPDRARGRRAPATPATAPPAVREVSPDEALQWLAGSAAEAAPATTSERRAGNELGGGQDVASGLAALRATTAAQAAAAVQRGSAEAPAGSTQNPPQERAAAPAAGGANLLDLCADLWYVNRRLYALDRAGHVRTSSFDDFAFELYGTSLAPGTYYYGPFAVGIRGSRAFRENVLVRVDGGARLGAGDVYAARVLDGLIPMMERGRAALGAGHGVGIVVSSHIREATPDASASRLSAAVDAARRHLGWAVRERLYQAVENPGSELLNVALGVAAQRLAAAVPVVGQVMLGMQAMLLARWMGTAADIALRARSNDEIDIAGQAIARKVADFAVAQVEIRAANAAVTAGGSALARRPGPPAGQAPDERPPPVDAVREKPPAPPQKTAVEQRQPTPPPEERAPGGGGPPRGPEGGGPASRGPEPRFITNPQGQTLDTSRITIPEGKFGYLLDREKGGIFRAALGFDRASFEPALRAHLARNFGTTTPLEPVVGGGLKTTVTGPMTGPNGRTIPIVSVWVADPDGTVRLVTAYPQ